MSHPSYFLGIDLGSSSVKTSLFDSDKGDTIDSITYPEKEMKIVAEYEDLKACMEKYFGQDKGILSE